MKVTEFFERYLQYNGEIGVKDGNGNTLYVGKVRETPLNVWSGRTVTGTDFNKLDGSLWLIVSDRAKHC